MKYQKQTLIHDPANGVYGDCARTAIAIMLGLWADEIPHFCFDGPDEDTFNQRRDTWLLNRGLSIVSINYCYDCKEDLLSAMDKAYPHTPYILLGKSSLGCHHNVVCIGGEIVCDPSQFDSGIAGPCDDGFFYVEFIIKNDLEG